MSFIVGCLKPFPTNKPERKSRMSFLSRPRPSLNDPEKAEKTVYEYVCEYPYPDRKGRRRSYFLFLALLAVSAALLVRLWDLAMYDNASQEVLSGQYTRRADAAKHTGFIYDRNGKLLSHAEEGAVALVNICGSRDKNAVAAYLQTYSALSPDELLEKINGQTPFALTLSAFPEVSPPRGVYVYPRYVERNGTLCRHLLGYRDADGIGKDGIYRRYDALLGKTGALSYRYFADAAGNQIAADAFCVINGGYTDTSGVILSVDETLQNKLDEVCDRYMDMGAAVLCDLADHSIAALSSRPVYDAENVAEYLNSERGELINRAFSLYTPGSVFKTVVAAAALESDSSLYDFSYECTGSITVSGKEFHCHKKTGHGVQNMREGFANSCNVYFIALAEKVGLVPICDMAQKLGLGVPHSVGALYVPAAKLPNRAYAHIPAYLANACIGQGDIMISPVDLASVYAACVTGVRRDLTLVKGIWESGKEETGADLPSEENGKMTRFCDTVPVKVLKDETVSRLREMMCACVKIGTGWQAGTGGIAVGGKTATAQSGQYKDGKEVLNRFFAGFYPADEPKYVLVILCDGNGENTAIPAKIFSEFVKAAG